MLMINADFEYKDVHTKFCIVNLMAYKGNLMEYKGKILCCKISNNSFGLTHQVILSIFSAYIPKCDRQNLKCAALY